MNFVLICDVVNLFLISDVVNFVRICDVVNSLLICDLVNFALFCDVVNFVLICDVVNLVLNLWSSELGPKSVIYWTRTGRCADDRTDTTGLCCGPLWDIW